MYRSKPENVIHMVGIGGIGMSGIAELLIHLGFPISGSDLNESDSVKRLQGLGAKVGIGHKEENLSLFGEECDVVVISSAIKESNPELLSARHNGIRILKRAEMLAELMHLKFGVAVAGTHGKTTTTSLVGSIFSKSDYDPTLVIGGKVDSLGGNAKLGGGKFMIAEADESDGSFLLLSPAISVVTNIDDDHLDHYGNFQSLKNAFLKFIDKTPFYGRSVLCGDDPIIRELLTQIKAPYLTYGLRDGCDLIASKLQPSVDGTTFQVELNGKKLGEIKSPLHGSHNVQNALAAIGVSLEAEIPFDRIKKGLEEFDGVRRRFQKIGEASGCEIYDDYAHHPTEIEKTVQAARSIWPDKKIIICFQPHRYSRTRDCFDKFAPSFQLADLVYITDIYPAGEAPLPGISGKSLVQHMNEFYENKENSPRVVFEADWRGLPDALKGQDLKDSVVMCLGAGTITKAPNLLLEEL